MADLNETPRQKMIGILYLVLLGLAATTITDHVLDAFYNISVSLDTTSKILQTATDNRMTAFQAHELKDDPKRAQPFWDRATQVKHKCDSLEAYLMYIKKLMADGGGGFKMDSGREGEVVQKADVDLSYRLMINQKRADTLKEKIMNTRNGIMDLLTADEKKGATVPLNVIEPKPREGVKQSWANDCFGEGIPLTAALTAVSKIEMDIKNTENSVIRKILAGVNQQDITFDDYEVIAVPQSNYVLIGQQYKASVFLTAFSTTLQPEIFVNGSAIKVENGMGTYTANPSSEGLQKYSATIRVKKSDGTMGEYKSKEDYQYMVAKPSVTISPTKMLVFYIGVDNPVSISAAGVGKESISTSVTGSGGGNITGAKGDYVVNVTKPGSVTISVSGELEKGKQTVLGSQEFRCKPIPPPLPKFAGSGGGQSSVSTLKAQTKVFAKLDDFEFDARFVVNGFRLAILKPRADAVILSSSTENLTPEMMSAMAGITAGTRIMIDNITATGPDKMKRSLNPISFTAQ